MCGGCPDAPGLVLSIRLALVCLFWSLWSDVLPHCGMPCGVARHAPPSHSVCRFFFCLSGVCWLCPPPPCWLSCPVLCVVVRPVVCCCSLWCVLCFARCCVACLCQVGFLRGVVRRGVVRCCVLCCFSFCFVPCLSMVFWAVSVSVVLCRGASCCSAWHVVFCVVACRVWVFAVGPGCPLLSPGRSWCLLVSCFGGVLWCVPGCCAAPFCCVLCRLALCFCALCCFSLLCLVLLRAVWCRAAPVCCPGILCLPVLCSVLYPGAFSFFCGVLLRAVVRRCALCRVRPGVSCCVFPVLPALCGVAVRPCSCLGALLPCAVPRGAVLLCGAVVSCHAALFGSFPVFQCLFCCSHLQNSSEFC